MRVRVFVFGDVVGVFYRQFVLDNALELGLNGWVRNVDDKVEIVLEGSEEKIKDMLKRCKKGSSGSKVEKIEVKEEKEEGVKGFEIRR